MLDEDDRPAAAIFRLVFVLAVRDPVHLEDVLVLRDGRVRLHRVLVPRRDRRLDGWNEQNHNLKTFAADNATTETQFVAPTIP